MRKSRGFIRTLIEVGPALSIQCTAWLVEQTRDQVRTGWLWWRSRRG